MVFGYLNVRNKMLNLQQKKLFDDSRNSGENKIQVFFEAYANHAIQGEQHVLLLSSRMKKEIQSIANMD
jgi:hypothetical protein